MKSFSSQGFQTTLALILVGIVALIGLNSFVIINPGEAGVLSILGKAQDGALLEGTHLKPPLISKVDIYDVTVQKFEVPAQSSTKDLQQLSASFAINFRLDPTQVVEIRRKQGTLQNIVSKIIAPQTQESFKIAAARRTVEEAITKRDALKQDFDVALGDRLQKYGIIVLDTSVVDLTFSIEFSKAVEENKSLNSEHSEPFILPRKPNRKLKRTLTGPRARQKPSAYCEEPYRRRFCSDRRSTNGTASFRW